MTTTANRIETDIDRFGPWLPSLMTIACIPLFPEYFAPLLAVIALLFAMRDAKKRHTRLRVGAAGKVLIAYLSFMTLHLLWADHRLLSAATLACWIAMLCVYLALSTILVSDRRIETALFTLSVITGLLGAVACAQYVCVGILGMTEVPLQIWDFVDRQIYAVLPFNVTLHSLGVRAAATFSNPNLFAQFMVMAIPVVAAYGFTGKRSAAKILARLSLLAAVMGTFFSFSRGAYLAIGAIAVVMCIANIRRLIPILMVAVSVLLLLPETIYNRLGSLADATDVALLERLDVWGVAMEIFFERPVTGHGIGIGAIWEALQGSGFSAPHAHNVFLQFLTEGGVIGLVILLFLVWKLFRIGFELIIHTPQTRMYGAAVIAFCGGFCVCGMVDLPLFTPKPVAMFMFMLAFADALGILKMQHEPLTIGQSLPFAKPITTRLEAWIKKATAPKEDAPVKEDNADE